MIIRFLDSRKNIVAKRGKKTKGISDKEKRAHATKKGNKKNTISCPLFIGLK